MKISFALELPTVALRSLGPETDFDFAIAYRVLEDDAYAEHYFFRKSGRMLVLDNGFHELGKPAGWDELRQAALLCTPDFIIIPDQKGPEDANDNLREMEKALDFMPPEKLALVVAGTASRGAREILVQAALDARIGMLCFGRTVDRLTWFQELYSTFGDIVVAPRIHLLGLRELGELTRWQLWAKDNRLDEEGMMVLSVDTSKPAKAALLGRTLSSNGDMRGMGVGSKTLFAQPMDEATLSLCRTNIATLRTACGG